MELTKRRNSDNDLNIHKKRLGERQQSVNTNVITCFEDLSNELIYEIFNYLDSCEVYDVFFNFNNRFCNLFLYSNLPIKITFNTTISRRDFQRYYNQIILPNQQRVQSLYIFNPFIIERLFSSTIIFLQLIELETLILNSIESKYLENLLNYLTTLPKLSSLVLICDDPNVRRDQLYNQIFHLPTLIYCKLSLKQSSCYISLPIATNYCSPIEYFITKNVDNINELPIILSYLPRLKHLSISSPYYFQQETIQQTSIQFEHLTHVTLNIQDLPFYLFQSLVRSYFHHIQVLYMSMYDAGFSPYIDANRWQNLILSSMPSLRILDIFIYYVIWGISYSNFYTNFMKQFDSSFWHNQGWNFRCVPCERYLHSNCRIFSVNPYRRKTYILDETIDSIHDINRQKILLNSVEHIEIDNSKSFDDYQISFPNVTQLTINQNGFNQNISVISSYLIKMIPLRQLTQFIYRTFECDLIKIIQIIQYMPNLKTFKIYSESLVDSNLSSIRQNETFQFVSQNSNITTMIIIYTSTIEEIDVLIDLCLRLKQLSIEKYNRNDKIFHLKDLFTNIQKNLKDLVFLSVTHSDLDDMEKCKTLIESKRLFYGWSTKYDECKNSMTFWL